MKINSITIFCLCALALLGSCSDKEKENFKNELWSFRSIQSDLVNRGCDVNEEDVDNISLSCDTVRGANELRNVREALDRYIAKGNFVIETDANAENKYLSEDERNRIRRKVRLANLARTSVIARLESS